MIELYHDDNYIISTQIKNNNEDGCLFNSEVFLAHQRGVLNHSSMVFTLYSIKLDVVVVSIDFSHSNDELNWVTPITGAFSEINALDTVSFYELELLLDKMKVYLVNEKKAVTLTWKIPPLYYNKRVTNKLFNVLLRQGWTIQDAELNFHINIIDYEIFRSNLSSSKRRELNKITKSDPQFIIEIEQEKCHKIYEVIRENRESQGYPMTMEWDAINNLRGAMGGGMIFSSINRDGTILAGAICLRLNKDSLYVFYWGEHPEYRKEAPVIKLAEQLFLLAMNDNYRHLDIGTSTVHSKPNQGLVNFKEHIGCEISQKFIMSYNGIS